MVGIFFCDLGFFVFFLIKLLINLFFWFFLMDENYYSLDILDVFNIRSCCIYLLNVLNFIFFII